MIIIMLRLSSTKKICIARHKGLPKCSHYTCYRRLNWCYWVHDVHLASSFNHQPSFLTLILIPGSDNQESCKKIEAQKACFLRITRLKNICDFCKKRCVYLMNLKNDPGGLLWLRTSPLAKSTIVHILIRLFHCITFG